MYRLLIALAILTIAFAASCGGGGTALTPPDDITPTGDNPLVVTPITPELIAGDHSVSIVPGRLNVVSGAEPAKLQAVIAKYGYDLLHQDGPRATIAIPESLDSSAAAKLLEKEFIIASAEPMHRIHTPLHVYPASAEPRMASFTPLDPFYSTIFTAFPNDGDGDGVYTYGARPGPALPMNVMGFNSAWDVSLNIDVSAEPVTVAIIDAGWFDYDTGNRLGLDETILDAANSGFVAADGTFTPGLAAAMWDTFTDVVGDPGSETYSIRPYRNVGEKILGILAATLQDYTPWGLDLDGNTVLEEDEIWNEGIAGINPNATYILVKTGEESGGAWTFSDNHLAESIDHAVTAGANIVILGMYGSGAVGANVSTAIQNARDNDVLVIAPAGDVADTFDGDAGDFTGTPVDITVDPVSPASDPNCVSVGGTGYYREPLTLGDVDGVVNGGQGWDFVQYTTAFTDPFHEVTRYSNTGADIAAVAMGIGFGQHPFLVSAGDGSSGSPFEYIAGDMYETFSLDAWGTVYSAAYVAGAASQVFQTLSFVDGTPPSDDAVLNELLNTVQLPNLDGTDGGGLLNAGAAMTSAINGGNLQTILPAMQFSSVTVSQPFVAVTRGTDFSVTPVVDNGTAPFSLEVDWGTGDPPETVDPWNNADPVTLTGGYEALGLTAVNLTVTDADGRTAAFFFEIHVINPLAINISVSDVEGNQIALAGLNSGEQYRFSCNPTNVYTGEIDGTPNNTSYNWYFTGLADPLPSPLPIADATGPSPVNSFATPGSYDLTLVVTEDVRPDSVWRVAVTVN